MKIILPRPMGISFFFAHKITKLSPFPRKVFHVGSRNMPNTHTTTLPAKGLLCGQPATRMLVPGTRLSALLGQRISFLSKRRTVCEDGRGTHGQCLKTPTRRSRMTAKWKGPHWKAPPLGTADDMAVARGTRTPWRRDAKSKGTLWKTPDWLQLQTPPLHRLPAISKRWPTRMRPSSCPQIAEIL